MSHCMQENLRNGRSSGTSWKVGLLTALLLIEVQDASTQNCHNTGSTGGSVKIGGCVMAGPPFYDENCHELQSQWGNLDFEIHWYSETKKFCQFSNCDPGHTENDNLSGITTGFDSCDIYELIPLPNADPELCGCPCETCPPELNSLKYKMLLGRGFDGLSPYYLWIHQEDISPKLFTPKCLTVLEAKGLKVYRNPDYSIRQVLSVSTLADVVTISPESFRVDLYAVDRDKAQERTKEGFLVPQGQAYRSHTFANPERGSLTQFEAVESSGKSQRRHLFEWNRESKEWSLQSGKGLAPFKTLSKKYDLPSKTLVKTTRTVDPGTGAAEETIRVFRDFEPYRQLLSTEKRLGDKQVSKDVFEYYDETAEPGFRGRLKSRRLHDGSWEKFVYDNQGRLIRKLSPWKDSPFESEDNQVKVESYTYLPLSPDSPYFHSLARMVREDTMIEGITVSTLYRIQSQSLIDGGPIKVEEVAAQPGAPFGADGNLLTVSRYYPVVEAEPSSGRLKSLRKPEGTLISYTYESGDYSGEEAVPGDFDPRVGGYFTRVTEIQGTEKQPNGFPERSIAKVTILSPSGRELLVESRIRPADSEDYSEVIAWTGNAYDVFDRKSLSRDATGIIGEYRYNLCCGKLEWERDRQGVETYYTRDEADRVTTRIVSAPGRPKVQTHYEYDPFGNVLRETILAGELVQETTREYDDEGELIATTTPDGLTTRYEHDHEARTHTTLLPGGATQVETRYLDGQVKAVTGTAVVAQHYDYGVTPDSGLPGEASAKTGLRWSQSTLAKADGPRWTRSHTDALGQAILQEQPGHGEGIVLAAHTAFDEKGRPIATQSGWKKIATGADGGRDDTFNPVGPVTLQTYDPETEEPLFSGQDLNRDEKLTPGQTDRVARSERRLEQVGNHWWEVSRQWTYPFELQGQPYLVGESRQRLTGLGIAAEDPALGVLVSETIQILPGNEEPRTKNLEQRSVIYRHRDTGVVIIIATDSNGLATVQRTESGLVTSIEEQGTKNKTTFSHDALGRRTAVIDPRAGESKVVYDPKTGQVIAQIDPENRANRYAYYPADHPNAGKMAYSANAEGKERHVAYTARGEQRAVWGESVQPLLFEYNEYGEMVGMKTFQTLPNGDPGLEEDKGAKTAWHFHDATGSLLKKEYADGHGPEYAYTESGQIKERQWARESNATSNDAGAKVGATGPVARSDNRLTTAYVYDPATLQLTKSTATDGTTVTYEYNPEGQLAKVTDATGSREFTYDIRGQVLKEAVTLLTGADAQPIHYDIRRSYTPLGQPSSVHLVSADGETVSLDHKVDYSWNAHNQLSSVKSLAGEFVYGYNEANPALLTKMTGPVHEVETTYESHRNLITGVTNRRKVAASGPLAEGAPISSYAYSNDVLGRRETISQGGEAFAMLKLGGNLVDVAYNERSEVTRATYSVGKETRQKFDYDYDGIGNRKSSASEVGDQKSEVSYQTNALNQYTSLEKPPAIAADSVPKPKDKGPTTSHDLDGNLIEDHKNRYTWDPENRLSRVDSKDGKLRLDYTYDYQSRRTTLVETKSPGQETEERKTTYYLYDAWNLLAEIDAVPAEGQLGTLNFKPATLLSWGRDMSGGLQSAGGVGGLLALSESGKHRFPAFDANGNVGQLLDENARAVAAYTYDPFGNVTEMAGAEAEQNPWRFSNKPVEAETGWVYYGYRWYDASAGRWVSRDPIEENGGVNLYGFVRNGSFNGHDILGLQEVVDCKKIKDCLEFMLSKGTAPSNLKKDGLFGMFGNVITEPLPADGGTLTFDDQINLTSKWKDSGDCKVCESVEKVLYVTFSQKLPLGYGDPDLPPDWTGINHGHPFQGLGAGGSSFTTQWNNNMREIGHAHYGFPTLGGNKYPSRDRHTEDINNTSNTKVEDRISYKVEVNCDRTVIFVRQFFAKT